MNGRSVQRVLGEERLRALLGSCGGRTAAEIAAQVEGVLLDLQEAARATTSR